jgi:hypothetical protein
MHRVHSDLDILVLQLRCNNHNSYTEKPTPPSSKGWPNFETRTCVGENINLGHGSRRDWSQKWRNDCAGEAQQQFNRPMEASQWVGGESRETLNYGYEFQESRNQEWLCWLGPAGIYRTRSQPVLNRESEIEGRRSGVGVGCYHCAVLSCIVRRCYQATTSEDVEYSVFAVVICRLCKLVRLL